MSSSVRGWAVIAAITAAVAVWLSSARSEGTAASAPAADVSAEDLPELVAIPAGPFRMGSDPAVDPRAYENERWSASSRQGTVELPEFFIGRHEITVGQFCAFVEATGHPADARALEAPSNHPVSHVSWPDALAYARWLETTLRASRHTPPPLRERLADGWRVTLPSEAEWEKAARGADARIFPWGNEPRPARANYQSSSPKPVGSFPCPECAHGLSDMSGNVWELTRSPYRRYPYDPTYDDVDLDADALWVMRGGSYGDPEQNVRTAIRGGADPGARRPFIGFRVVLTPSTP